MKSNREFLNISSINVRLSLRQLASVKAIIFVNSYNDFGLTDYLINIECLSVRNYNLNLI